MIQTAYVVNSFTITTGKEIPSTQIRPQWEGTALGVCQQNIIPVGRMSCGLQLSLCQVVHGASAMYIVDPLDLQYPSCGPDNEVSRFIR